MKTIALAALVGAVIFGNAPAAAEGSDIGQFVMSGPSNAIAENLSMRWQYGLMLNIDPQEISTVKFSCDPIPGTTFTANGNEFRRLKNGALFIQGPVLLVSNETTPWLFEASTTSADCTAVVSRPNQPDANISAKVNFSGTTKAATLQQLKLAHYYNSPSKR